MLARCKELGFSTNNYKDINHPLTNYIINKVCELCEINKEEILIRGIGGDRIVPIGSHIVEYYWVEPIDDCSKFRFELKTTGSCFSGDVNKINKYISDMNAIIEKYKK